MRLIRRRTTVVNPSDVLNRVSILLTELRTTASNEQITSNITDVILEFIPADAALLVHRDPESQKDEILQARGGWSFLFGGSRTAPTGPLDHVDGTILSEALSGKETRSVFLCESPLQSRGRNMGIIWLGRLARNTQDFSAEERRMLQFIADIAAGAMLQFGMAERLERQQSQIQSMRSVERAITSSLDLSVILNVFLDQAMAQLNADAASVMQLDAQSHAFTMAASRGYLKNDYTATRFRADHNLALQASLERKTVFLSGSTPEDPALGNQPLMRSEEFLTYLAAPLIAHGQVKGVLEVFRRKIRDQDSEWQDLLESLAVQGAIAIDNAESFLNLQRTHSELKLACDSTIEGWSRAVDLRAQEAEGHSLRVSDLVVRLAEKMGIPVEQMLSIRRGSLLHDIGKIGVPDQILWKPESLTEDEWTLMRQHPKYAEQLLSPIEFLRSAIDIPKYHHERWDGRGYPYGLAGTDIPLAARLFSIVDVWDSLQARRPFRSPWTHADTMEYLKKGSGSQFDPEAVDAFLNILHEPE
jgi:HD-GYP domain-containing protein (c-di-GMP phosphodiesterase class II)